MGGAKGRPGGSGREAFEDHLGEPPLVGHEDETLGAFVVSSRHPGGRVAVVVVAGLEGGGDRLGRAAERPVQGNAHDPKDLIGAVGLHAPKVETLDDGSAPAPSLAGGNRQEDGENELPLQDRYVASERWRSAATISGFSLRSRMPMS